MLGVRGVGLALLVVALAGAAASSAASRAPRFALAIVGTQRLEWTLDLAEGSNCAVKGHGVQTLEFRTPRTIRVVATKNYAGAGPGGYHILPIGTGKTVIPLTGTETRRYTVETATATGCSDASRVYAASCTGTNAFLNGAAVAMVWAGTAVEMHVPVQTLLYERRPKACDLLLFDIRTRSSRS